MVFFWNFDHFSANIKDTTPFHLNHQRRHRWLMIRKCNEVQEWSNKPAASKAARVSSLIRRKGIVPFDRVLLYQAKSSSSARINLPITTESSDSPANAFDEVRCCHQQIQKRSLAWSWWNRSRISKAFRPLLNWQLLVRLLASVWSHGRVPRRGEGTASVSIYMGKCARMNEQMSGEGVPDP